MRKAAYREGKALTVTVNFEPNRLSDECLANAYELAFPLVQQDAAIRGKKSKPNGKSSEFKKERLVI